MRKEKQEKAVSKDGNIPRQVRMPPVLDQWLEEEAARSTVRATVADKIREIVAAAYEAKQGEQQAA